MRLSSRRAVAVVVLLFVRVSFAADAPATTQASSSSSDFLRFVEDGKGGGVLQTAIVGYRNQAGAQVDLVGAVHVGEPGYYHKLNDRFAGYDALLYEMVKPRDSGVPEPGQKPASAISMFQHWLKDALALDYQLDDIDYTAPNFVHADLDYETFSQLQNDRGESMLTIMLQSMLKEMAKETEGTRKSENFGLIDLIIALRAPDRARQLKLLLAGEFNQIEDQMSGLEGPDGSVIITERNKRALEVLKQNLDAGKTHLAIFFGAAHMSDMSKRLKAMGFSPTGQKTWVTAWDMTAAPASQPSTQGAGAGGDGK